MIHNEMIYNDPLQHTGQMCENYTLRRNDTEPRNIRSSKLTVIKKKFKIVYERLAWTLVLIHPQISSFISEHLVRTFLKEL